MESECEHKFDEEFVCIKCELKSEPFSSDPFSYKQIRKNTMNNKAVIKYLEDLNLDPGVILTAYEMYQQVTKNKIYRSKMLKIILCSCICKAFGEEDSHVQDFLNHFNINEKDYKGVKKINF